MTVRGKKKKNFEFSIEKPTKYGSENRKRLFQEGERAKNDKSSKKLFFPRKKMIFKRLNLGKVSPREGKRERERRQRGETIACCLACYRLHFVTLRLLLEQFMSYTKRAIQEWAWTLGGKRMEERRKNCNKLSSF